MKSSKALISICVTLAVLGCLAGAEAVRLRIEIKNVFEQGRQQGLRECQEPSRIEKAAKWLAE